MTCTKILRNYRTLGEKENNMQRRGFIKRALAAVGLAVAPAGMVGAEEKTSPIMKCVIHVAHIHSVVGLPFYWPRIQDPDMCTRQCVKFWGESADERAATVTIHKDGLYVRFVD